MTADAFKPLTRYLGSYMQNKGFKTKNYNYRLEVKKPYPKTIWWDVVAPKGAKLSILQDHDIVFDDYDMKMRQLPY